MSSIRNKFLIALFPFALALAACVPADQLPPSLMPAGPGGSGAGASAYGDLDQGNTQITTAHFTLKGYSEYDLRPIGEKAETIYNKISNDTGLYSFLSSGMFTIVVYKDRDEYLKKTHQPIWSSIVVGDKAIYLYPTDDLEAVLAHYMTHLIMNAYLGEKASSNKWFIEGLAMNEEASKMFDSDRNAYLASKSSQLRQNRMPFSQMTFFVTATEEKRRTDAWYQQVESVVTYMLSQGSALATAQFLSELRSGTELDQAISDAFTGKIRGMSDLENLWKNTI